jgi:cyanophycinase
MNGSLALVGSGEYLPAMAPFESSLIADGVKNGKEARYLQIPTAAGRESADRLQYWRSLGQRQADALGVPCTYLPIYSREDAFNHEYVNAVANSALMYMSGGDPHHLGETLIDTPLWSAIIENWNTGASLAGCSAGAMVLSSQIPNFRLLKKAPTAGLNLLPEIRVIPHFNKFFKWIPESAAKILMDAPEGTILMGIDELTALVRRSGVDFWQATGDEKVHILKGLPNAPLSAGESINF